MDWKKKEVCNSDPNCELRIGDPSWGGDEPAMKYTWFTSLGHPARGGEFPLKALPEMLDFAIRSGYITIK